MDTATKLIGQRFGKLVVVGPSDPGKGEFLFACDCGQTAKRNIHTARRNLKNGYTVSCGCSRSYAKMLGDNNPQRRKGQHKPMAKCEYCQKEFKVMGNRIGRKYCSVLCSNYVRAADKIKDFALTFLSRVKAKLNYAKRKCNNCSVPLIDLECRDKFCSDKCQRLHHRRNSPTHWLASRLRKNAVRQGDGTTINSLAKKYGWKCQLCLKLIDPSLAFPHTMSPTIDHKVPLSKGGAHVEANCQLAHLSCNSTQGDSMSGKSIDLFCFASQ